MCVCVFELPRFDREPPPTMRQLKHHEQKLLKKVDLLAWKGETNHREVAALRRYLIQDRDDYKKYNR